MNSGSPSTLGPRNLRHCGSDTSRTICISVSPAPCTNTNTQHKRGIVVSEKEKRKSRWCEIQGRIIDEAKKMKVSESTKGEKRRGRRRRRRGLKEREGRGFECARTSCCRIDEMRTNENEREQRMQSVREERTKRNGSSSRTIPSVIRRGDSRFPCKSLLLYWRGIGTMGGAR